MKLLAEITDFSLGLGKEVEQMRGMYELRKSARAILLRDDGLVASQYIGRDGYHKLPGGGVEQGESIEEALKRELLEEVGCTSEIIYPIGIVIEYRAKYNLLHISYGFVAKLTTQVDAPKLEAKEIEEKQETRWVDASNLLQNMQVEQKSMLYEGRFILEREMAFLREYLKS